MPLSMKTNLSVLGLSALSLLMTTLVLIEAHRLLAAAAPPGPQPPQHSPTLPPAHESVNAQSSAEIMAGGVYRT